MVISKGKEIYYMIKDYPNHDAHVQNTCIQKNNARVYLGIKPTEQHNKALLSL
jgi:hypothetical protein